MLAAVLTISDKGSRGERVDASGPVVAQLLETIGVPVVLQTIIPDEREIIAAQLIRCADIEHFDLIVTTGGTGVAPRDVTPEATKSVIDRELPGMAEAMRMESFKKTPHAVISRAVCGIRGQTLIINLPGSPRAAAENLQTILRAIPHTIEKIHGDPTECAVP